MIFRNWNIVTGPPLIWRVPVNGDTATLSDTAEGSTVTLSDNTGGIDGLTVENGFWLDTNDHLLLVDGGASAETNIHHGSQITVREYAANSSSRGFDSDRLRIHEGGVFYLDGAIADVDVYAEIRGVAVPDGVLEGSGTMHFGSNLSTPGAAVLWNQGIIRVSGVGDATLRLESRNDGEFDLGPHSDFDGALDVDDGTGFLSGSKTLEVVGPMRDFFGNLTIGRGDTADFSEPWTAVFADIQFNGVDANATLSGAGVEVQDSLVQVNSGAAVIASDANFGSGAIIDVNAALQLDGVAVFNSNANLDLNGATALIVNGQTTVYQSVIDLDSNGGMLVTVNPGGWLTLNVDEIDDDVPAGFNRDMNIGGTLDANVTGGWIADGDVQLTGGRLTGSTVNNEGLIRGYGTIDASGLINDGVIAAEGGTLVLDSSGDAFDLDGATDMGVLEAVDGDLEVREGDLDFYGRIQVGSGHLAEFDGRLTTRGDARVHLSGGTLRTSLLSSYGDGGLIVSNAPSQIEVDRTMFIDGQPLTINSDLTLTTISGVLDGAAFVGPTITADGTGRIIVADDFALLLRVGTTMGVAIRNEGRFTTTGPTAIDFIGRVDVKSYEQTEDGRLEIKIEGTDPADFDQLYVAETADIDGWLRVLLYDDFVPALGDSFEIIAADGGLTGAFSDYNFNNADLPERLLWHVNYDYPNDRVLLEVIATLDADFDEDGDVDDEDLESWESGYGIASGAAHSHGDANGDGAVNGRDFRTWQRQYGESVAPSVVANVPQHVPEPTSFLLIVSLVGAALHGRCARRLENPSARKHKHA